MLNITVDIMFIPTPKTREGNAAPPNRFQKEAFLNKQPRIIDSLKKYGYETYFLIALIEILSNRKLSFPC